MNRLLNPRSMEPLLPSRPAHRGFLLAVLFIAGALLCIPVESVAQINIPTLDGKQGDQGDIIKTAKSYFSAILNLVIYVLYAAVFVGGSYIIITAFLEAKNSKSGWGGFMLTFMMTIAGVALSVYFLSLALEALSNIT